MSYPLIEVTDEMVEAVEKLLEDSTEHVRVPAAILLYCIDKQCEKVNNLYCMNVQRLYCVMPKVQL